MELLHFAYGNTFKQFIQLDVLNATSSGKRTTNAIVLNAVEAKRKVEHDNEILWNKRDLWLLLDLPTAGSLYPDSCFSDHLAAIPSLLL